MNLLYLVIGVAKGGGGGEEQEARFPNWNPTNDTNNNNKA